MKKSFILFSLLVLCFGLVGCQSLKDMASVNPKDHSTALDPIIAYLSQEATDNLSKIAPIFAEVFEKYPGIKEIVIKEIGNQFDGTYDVLYQTIAEKPTKDGITLEKALLERDAKILEMIKAIPHFNISIPVNYELAADYKEPMYVIPMRYDIQDEEIEVLKGYRSYNEALEFWAKEAPEYPVFVLGINERVEMMKNEPISPIGEEEVKPEMGLTYINHNERLRALRITTKNEPWYLGDPEVYALYAIGDNELKLKQYYDHVNSTSKWYYFNHIVFSYDDRPSHMYWKFKLMEEDWSWNINITVSGSFTWNGIKFDIKGTFTITNGDDDFGETQIYFFHNPNYQTYYLGRGYVGVGY